jgi:predicted DNA-binding transcriptional regulator AlpA
MRFAAETIHDDLATLTREQAARALGISLDTLDALHARNEGPPRFRASPRRWAYPAADFRRWQQRQMASTEPQTAV